MWLTNPSCPDVSFLRYPTGIMIRQKTVIQTKYLKRSFFLNLNLKKNTIDSGIIIKIPSYLTKESKPTIKNAK